MPEDVQPVLGSSAGTRPSARTQSLSWCPLEGEIEAMAHRRMGSVAADQPVGRSVSLVPSAFFSVASIEDALVGEGGQLDRPLDRDTALASRSSRMRSVSLCGIIRA